MIFFISNKEDITTDILINKLNHADVSYFRLNTEDLISNTECILDYDKGLFSSNNLNNKPYNRF